MTAREDEIVAAFVSMAGSLVEGGDITELLDRLAADCARLLDVTAVGLLLADRRGALHVVATSSERVADLEAFQAQRGQGPCHDCYLDNRPVNVPDLAAAAQRWPGFAALAATAGVASVHAVPMRLCNNVLGALNLFGATRGTLNEADLRLAQALAESPSSKTAPPQTRKRSTCSSRTHSTAAWSSSRPRASSPIAVTWTCRRRTQRFGSTPETTTSNLRSLQSLS